MNLGDSADELYGLPPEEFAAARNTKAKDAAAAGDRKLGQAIKSLKRPTVSAWLLNMLLRQHGKQLTELLDLGVALREAQAELAGDDLKRLLRQRHHAIYALAQQARHFAAGVGHRVIDAVERELEANMEAALAYPAAADALRTGRW